MTRGNDAVAELRRELRRQDDEIRRIERAAAERAEVIVEIGDDLDARLGDLSARLSRSVKPAPVFGVRV